MYRKRLVCAAYARMNIISLLTEPENIPEKTLQPVLKGKRCNERFTEITEDRGTTLILPFTNLKFCKNDRQQEILHPRVCIKTPN